MAGSRWLLRLLPLKAQDYIDIVRDYWEAAFEWITEQGTCERIMNRSIPCVNLRRSRPCLDQASQQLGAHFSFPSG